MGKHTRTLTHKVCFGVYDFGFYIMCACMTTHVCMTNCVQLVEAFSSTDMYAFKYSALKFLRLAQLECWGWLVEKCKLEAMALDAELLLSDTNRYLH